MLVLPPTILAELEAFFLCHVFFERCVNVPIKVRTTGATYCDWLANTHTTKRNGIHLQRNIYKHISVMTSTTAQQSINK